MGVPKAWYHQKKPCWLCWFNSWLKREEKVRISIIIIILTTPKAKIKVFWKFLLHPAFERNYKKIGFWALFPDFRSLYCGFVGWNLGVMSTAKVFNFHLSFSTWNVAYICTATASPESSQYYCGFDYFTRKFALSKILIKVSLVFLVITFLLKNNFLIVRFFQGKLGSLCEDLLYYVCSCGFVTILNFRTTKQNTKFKFLFWYRNEICANM